MWARRLDVEGSIGTPRRHRSRGFQARSGAISVHRCTAGQQRNGWHCSGRRATPHRPVTAPARSSPLCGILGADVDWHSWRPLTVHTARSWRPSSTATAIVQSARAGAKTVGRLRTHVGSPILLLDLSITSVPTADHRGYDVTKRHIISLKKPSLLDGVYVVVVCLATRGMPYLTYLDAFLLTRTAPPILFQHTRTLHYTLP